MFNRTHWSAIGAAAVIAAGGLTLPAAQATTTDGGGAGAVFVPIVPCRLFDTRAGADNVGVRSSPIVGGEPIMQSVTGTNGNCSIPAQATGVSLNVTIANPDASSYLTLWPADAPQPLASNLNWTPTSPPTPNKVDVKLSAKGTISIFNKFGKVDVLADVVGYYTDHNHDDRYSTKTQVDAAVAAASASLAASVSSVAASSQRSLHHDMYGPRAMVFTNPTPGATSVNNCATTTSPGGATGIVPLVVPIGARIMSVDIALLAGPTTYTLSLYRSRLGPTGSSDDAIAYVDAGNLAGLLTLHYVLTPTVAEIVAADESFYLRISSITNANIGFCNAQVTYDANG